MAVNPVTYYEVVCDEPGCGFKTSDLDSDYSAWSDSGAALDDWINADGVRIDDDGRTFCPEHAGGKVCDGCGEARETTENTDGEHMCSKCAEGED